VAEFRPQGRGGLGLVAAKLARNDALAAAAITVVNADIAVITDGGRVARLPVDAFPEMGRPARGDRVVAPAEGESVIAIARLLPGPRAARR
jgi:DNA gyrase subunit A